MVDSIVPCQGLTINAEQLDRERCQIRLSEALYQLAISLMRKFLTIVRRGIMASEQAMMLSFSPASMTLL
ncbi:MAG: hypothetical protein HC837_08045 [Chloroflexaceae bacterium]|nr:hypothetical protein [Chloroflexaceae bacterium]